MELTGDILVEFFKVCHKALDVASAAIAKSGASNVPINLADLMDKDDPFTNEKSGSVANVKLSPYNVLRGFPQNKDDVDDIFSEEDAVRNQLFDEPMEPISEHFKPNSNIGSEVEE